MITPGIVVVTIASEGLIVVDHDHGFTVVELIEDDVPVRPGDRIGANWTSYGGDNLFKLGVKHDAFFHCCWSSIEEAVDAARDMLGRAHQLSE
jgi:hypothetical protein